MQRQQSSYLALTYHVGTDLTGYKQQGIRGFFVGITSSQRLGSMTIDSADHASLKAPEKLWK